MGLISKAAERFGRRGMPSPTWLVPGLAAAAQKAELEAATRPVEQPTQLVREPTKYELAILNGLQGKPVYQGTVPAHVTERRRAKNRVARKTRRVSRQRAQ
jgi:hypothetical protein